MKRMGHLILMGILAGVLGAAAPLWLQASEDEHGNHDAHGHETGEAHDEHEEHEEGGIRLTAEQQSMAGIVVETLQPRDIAGELRAPGEIQLNAYETSRVAPRIAAQVVERQAKLGDRVEKGQVLLTLSSVEMAQAQGDLLVAEREWQRVSKLGKEVVSDQRYTEARISREQARARVSAFGMTDDEIGQLVATGKAELANGRFRLLAPQAGTVISDHFVVGELVEPGGVLFEISNESILWVEARLTPDEAARVAVDAPATVLVGDQTVEGRVTQVHHALDEATRTLAVRIEVPNPEDRLHPGLFVEVRIASGTIEQALAVPEEAVLRSPDGDWQVFVEHEPGEFEPREVEILRTSAGRSVIEGVKPGTHVVTRGAFFLQSELAKSGFDIHAN